tara:strand:- start:2757 stop:2945 length:189 start_codon:yes stop_codon:yes gene_type:complete
MIIYPEKIPFYMKLLLLIKLQTIQPKLELVSKLHEINNISINNYYMEICRIAHEQFNLIKLK